MDKTLSIPYNWTDTCIITDHLGDAPQVRTEFQHDDEEG